MLGLAYASISATRIVVGNVRLCQASHGYHKVDRGGHVGEKLSITLANVLVLDFTSAQ